MYLTTYSQNMKENLISFCKVGKHPVISERFQYLYQKLIEISISVSDKK